MLYFLATSNPGADQELLHNSLWGGLNLVMFVALVSFAIIAVIIIGIIELFKKLKRK